MQQGMMGDVEREGHRLTNWNQIFFHSVGKTPYQPVC